MRYNGKTDTSTISGRVRALGFERYADYLASPHWKDVRERFYAVHPRRCSCGSTKAVALHHLTYERLGAERLEDLEALCGACHRRRHRLRSKSVPTNSPKPKRKRRRKKRPPAKPDPPGSRGYQRGEVKAGPSRLTYHP